MKLPGFTVETGDLPTDTARFEPICTLTEMDGVLAGTIKYGRDLFEAPTIQRLTTHFARLLTEATADPGRPLSELPLFTSAEIHQIVDEESLDQTANSIEPAMVLLHSEEIK